MITQLVIHFNCYVTMAYSSTLLANITIINSNEMNLVLSMCLEYNVVDEHFYQIKICQVHQVTSNGKSHNIVKEYLQNLEGIVSIKSSKYEEFITAVAPIAVWEKMLETKFILVANVKGKTANEKIKLISGDYKNIIKKAVRTLQYKLPKVLRGHVTTVLNTVQAPQFEKNKKVVKSAKKIDSKIISEINNYSANNNYIDNRLHGRKKRNFENNEDNKDIVEEVKLSADGTRKKSISLGFTFPRLLNEVYNIYRNKGNSIIL